MIRNVDTAALKEMTNGFCQMLENSEMMQLGSAMASLYDLRAQTRKKPKRKPVEARDWSKMHFAAPMSHSMSFHFIL